MFDEVGSVVLRCSFCAHSTTEARAADTPDEALRRMRATREVAWRYGLVVAPLIDWSDIDGPSDYNPTNVASALDALAHASDIDDATAAYHRLLFAVGNDHAGMMYPAAVVAVSAVIEAALEGTASARWAALQVMLDWFTSFLPHPSFKVAVIGGESRDVLSSVRRAIEQSQGKLRARLGDETDMRVRAAIEDLLSEIAEA